MVCTITEMLCVIAYQSIERNTGTTFLTTSVPCYMMLHSLTSNFWVKVWSHDQPSDSYLRLCPRKPILWAQTYITWFTWYEQLAPIHLGGVTIHLGGCHYKVNYNCHESTEAESLSFVCLSYCSSEEHRLIYIAEKHVSSNFRFFIVGEFPWQYLQLVSSYAMICSLNFS